MGKAETVIVSLVCVGCLAIPVVMLLGGALEPEEVHIVGGGTVTYQKSKDDLEIRSYGKRNALPVTTRNAGKRPIERSADDIPTKVVEEQVHTDAHEIQVRSFKRRGLHPEAPPEQ